MSKIFELFGYRLDAWGPGAVANRKRAWCPFMDAECDGGGNRYLSAIDLDVKTQLQSSFPGKSIVQAGICSLRVRDSQQPWIVCPRRLFSLRNQPSKHQKTILEEIVRYSELPAGNSYRAWSEVKMQIDTTNADDEEKYFDYTFDYIITGSRRIPIPEVAALIGKSNRVTTRIAEENGFTLRHDNGIWIDDFPSDPVVIVEIMTSSTSGGDKRKRTQIAMAFEDAVLSGAAHNGPGINYRQVWARMVSQLIVKSQVGLSWGGKTFWLVQDVLADYISSSTALNLAEYLSQHPDEVNILAFGYGAGASPNTVLDRIVPLNDKRFYAGPISRANEGDGTSAGFIDIVKIGAPPPKEKLWRSLFLKRPVGSFTL